MIEHIRALRDIRSAIKEETKRQRAQLAKAEKLLAQTKIEIQEVTAEVAALQEAHWQRMKATFPEIDTILHQQIS